MIQRKSSIALISLTLLADLALVISPTRYGGAFVLLWILPGLGWATWLTDDYHRIGVEEILLGLGLGMGTIALLTLAIHYIPGPFPFVVLLIATNFTTVMLALKHPVVRLKLTIQDSPTYIAHIGLIILVAIFFRFFHLGYSEFQGDESIIMMRAARAITGDDEQLFYHQKGPLEILVPLATWRLSGTINEWQVRLPFAFFGCLGVLAVYLLGRHWFNYRVALIAALLLSINGYFVGFGRIVQYQSLVLAMTTMALLAIERWSKQKGDHWLYISAALLALGFLGHYDAILTLPAIAYIVGRKTIKNYKRSNKIVHTLKSLTGAATLAIGILSLFYVPFVRHPNFAKTFSYLSSDRLGSENLLYNNLLPSISLATFYNSTYYLVILTSLLIIALLFSFRRWQLLLPATGIALLFFLRSSIWAIPVVIVLLGITVLASKTSPQSRVVWVWFSFPFLFYYFLVWDPRTHVLNVFPPGVLLAGFALDHLLRQIPIQRTYYMTDALLLALFLFLAYYPYVMFLQHTPEIKRTWPTHRPAAYWRPKDVPLFGYFGFPYRAGWKVIGKLIEKGHLTGTYNSNEEFAITNWYTRGAERTYCSRPDWYFIAKNVQDSVEIPRSEIKDHYHLWGKVLVGSETKLQIYHSNPLTDSVKMFQVKVYSAGFDNQTTPHNAIPTPPKDYIPAGHTLGNMIRLLGYRLNTQEAHPGESIKVTLYWKALKPMKANYQVFNHLYDSEMWGQQDGTPACAFRPTTLWEPGQVIRDEYTIPIDSSTPPGDIPLVVGMYGLISKERLPVYGPDGQPMGDSISLGTVTVQ